MSMAKKDQSIMTSLGRISAYLPNTRLDHFPRVRIDDRGRVWVEEDTILIVLRGHLIVEHELVDICDRFLPQPDALSDRLNFDTRLRLVRALLGDDRFSNVIYDIIKDLNRIRNNLGHKLDTKDLHNDLCRFVERFSVFPDFKGLIKSEGTPERLNTCITVLCGMLGSFQPEAS
jgi:hypothetical protein